MFWGYESRCTAVRDGKWKFITSRYHGWELYNLEDDLAEEHNLASEMPDKAGELNLAIARWRQDVHSQYPVFSWGKERLLKHH